MEEQNRKTAIITEDEEKKFSETFQFPESNII